MMKNVFGDMLALCAAESPPQFRALSRFLHTAVSALPMISRALALDAKEDKNLYRSSIIESPIPVLAVRIARRSRQTLTKTCQAICSVHHYHSSFSMYILTSHTHVMYHPRDAVHRFCTQKPSRPEVAIQIQTIAKASEIYVG